MEEEEEQKKAFTGASDIVYVLDYPIYIEKKELIIDDIIRIHKILRKIEPKATLTVFFHKIDLISQKNRNLFSIITDEINRAIPINLSFQIYFTSLQPTLIYTIFNAFAEIMIKFSQKLTSIKKIIDRQIHNFEGIICLITDEKNNVILQSITKDIQPQLIRFIYKVLSEIRKNKKSVG
ncbi:MAG: hypothetical protein BAJALOKI1v1_30011 [Promethearchaeota archaeon]|nr:MAG: hypothetical protein BAJALOKI1v1_30011 [Candidatus Lokiarchaeota archaeon]